MIKRIITFTTILLTLSSTGVVRGQKLIESLAGIVGNEVILLSDIEEQVQQIRSTGNRTPVEKLRCMVFEEAVVQKLFLDQARIDSVIVTAADVEGDINMRLNSIITQAGSEKALEDHFKKSIIEIKADLRDLFIDDRTVKMVQSSIAEGITVTPGEVRRYYNSIPKDSIPLIPAMVEVSIIQIDPPSNEENKLIARQRILDLRSEILGGKSFEVMARLYSEDDGSAIKGGEIGYMPRGGLAKEYADVAFTLNNKTVSRVLETEFGFHIMQLIDRRGELVNTRHILIKPKITPDDILKATAKLDSVADLIRRDSVTFENAARLISSHTDSRMNGGNLVKGDPDQRITIFTLEELDKDMYQIVRNMKVGEISKTYRTTDEKGKTVFRIVRLDNEIPAHRATLEIDYELMQSYTLFEKQSKKYTDWLEKKFEVTYIRVSEEFKQCDFTYKQWLK
jgi:peptidyl-prolyl cis-trans isomerase SurA